MTKVAMLGTGVIANFYAEALHGKRGRDRIHIACSRTEKRAGEFAKKWGVPKTTTSLKEAVNDDEVEAVIIAIPNYLHEEAVLAAAEAGKAILCTKPLGRNAKETVALGYIDMFTDMLDSIDQNQSPGETFYDGYIVNAIVDAAYKSIDSKKWEPIDLPVWRGRKDVENVSVIRNFDDQHLLIKKEQLPDGRTKVILKHKETGKISEREVS